MIVFQEAVYLSFVSGTGNSKILPQNMSLNLIILKFSWYFQEQYLVVLYTEGSKSEDINFVQIDYSYDTL